MKTTINIKQISPDFNERIFSVIFVEPQADGNFKVPWEYGSTDQYVWLDSKITQNQVLELLPENAFSYFLVYKIPETILLKSTYKSGEKNKLAFLNKMAKTITKIEIKSKNTPCIILKGCKRLLSLLEYFNEWESDFLTESLLQNNSEEFYGR